MFIPYKSTIQDWKDLHVRLVLVQHSRLIVLLKNFYKKNFILYMFCVCECPYNKDLHLFWNRNTPVYFILII